MQDRKELLEDLLDISKEHFKNSPECEVEFLHADMKLSKQLVRINKALAEVKTAQYAFNKVLNLENNTNLYDAKEESVFSKEFFTNLELPSQDELVSYAYSHRYDIKMAQVKLQKAQKEIEVAYHKRIPDLQVAGGYAFAHDGTSGAFVGAGVDMPLLHTFTPEIKSAKLEHEKAQLEHNSIMNIAKNIILTNYDKFIMAQENVNHYKNMIDKSRRVLSLSKLKYKKKERNSFG